MRRLRVVMLLVVNVLFISFISAADPPKPDRITVIDSTGKEIKFSVVKLTTGFRRLAWLGQAELSSEDGNKGPLAFELREANSTTYAKGVVTLVPASTIESVRYEPEKQTLSLTAAGLPGSLTGTTQFKGINVLGIEGDVGGVTAKLSGGVPKTGFKEIRFIGAKPLPKQPTEVPWSVQIDQPKAGNPTLAVMNLRALVALPGGKEVLVEELTTRKAGPIKLQAGSFDQMEIVAVDPARSVAVEISSANRAEAKTTTAVIPLSIDVGKQKGTLIGLLGEVPGGWKLFPWHTILKITPGPSKGS